MKDNIINFEELKKKKEDELKQQEIDKQNKERKEQNTELFKEITGKATLFLTLEEMHAYNEIGVLCTFSLKGMYSMAIAAFRGQLYVINHIGGKFEYIGTLEDVVSKGIFGDNN